MKTKVRWVKDRDSNYGGVKAVGKLVVLYVDSAQQGVWRWAAEPKDTGRFGGRAPIMNGEAESEAAAKAAAVKAAPKLAGKVKMMRETAEVEADSDLTEEKLTPESLLAYMKKTGQEIEVEPLAYSFKMSTQKVAGMLGKMFKQGKLSRRLERKVHGKSRYVYTLPEQTEDVDSYITEAVKDSLTKMLPWADDPEFGGMNAV